MAPVKYSEKSPSCSPGHAMRGLFCIGLVFSMLAGAQAEEMPSRFFRDIALGSGLHFQRWSGEGDLSVREFSIPVTFILPLSKRLSLDLVTGSGFATLDRGASSDLSGLTDTKIRASFVLGDELALLTAGLSTPTGKTELDADEQQVSNFLSQNALGFRTPHFGQGLDVNVGAATAGKIGETVFGLGAGYLMKGEFTPQDGGPDYQPGNELSLTGGVDRKLMDGEGKLTLDVVYTLYGEDEREGKRAFQSGDKLLVQALGQFRVGGMHWRVHLIERSKAKNTSYAGASAVEFSNGNQVEAGLSILKSLSPKLGVRGLGEVKLYGANDFNRGEATIFGVGPGIRLKLSPRRFIDLNAKYARGSIDDATVIGMDISGGIWIRL